MTPSDLGLLILVWVSCTVVGVLGSWAIDTLDGRAVTGLLAGWWLLFWLALGVLGPLAALATRLW